MLSEFRFQIYSFAHSVILPSYTHDVQKAFLQVVWVKNEEITLYSTLWRIRETVSLTFSSGNKWAANERDAEIKSSNQCALHLEKGLVI